MNFWKKRDGASLLRREPKARITGEEWEQRRFDAQLADG